MRHAPPFVPLLALAALAGCTPTSSSAPAPAPTPVAAPGAGLPSPTAPGDPPPKVETPPPVSAEDAKPVFGGPIALDRLALYPITLAVQEDIGPVITLDEALAKGSAEVREVGAETREAAVPQNTTNAPNPAPQRVVRNPRNELEQQNDNPIEQQAAGGGGNATVNTLVIENKGEVPIFVLAGTVVKGGKQDRQIGQDFIVQAKQTLPVDAFCVEHGRWTAERQGALTGGRFTTMPVLANSKVRAAGQYKKNQGEVWDEVAKTNKVHGKQAESGTLMATLDDKEVAAKVDSLAGRVDTSLAAVSPNQQLVGFAWAIDGKLQGVRWFAHHRLFELAKEPLVKTAAVDTLTAEAEGVGAGKAPPSPAEVEKLLAEVEAQTAVERKTDGGNDNEYRESDKAWGAKTMLKSKDGKKAKPVAHDYLMK